MSTKVSDPIIATNPERLSTQFDELRVGIADADGIEVGTAEITRLHNRSSEYEAEFPRVLFTWETLFEDLLEGQLFSRDGVWKVSQQGLDELRAVREAINRAFDDVIESCPVAADAQPS